MLKDTKTEVGKIAIQIGNKDNTVIGIGKTVASTHAKQDVYNSREIVFTTPEIVIIEMDS